MRALRDGLLARAPPSCRPGLGLGAEPSLAFRGVDARTVVEPAARHAVDAGGALADVTLDGAPPAALPGGCGVSRFLCARETLALAPLPGCDHVAAPYSSLRRLRHRLLRGVLGRVPTIGEGPALGGHPGVHVLAPDPAHRDDAPVAVLVALLALDGARADAPGEHAGDRRGEPRL